MTLESIVPSLETCKLIPQGSFAESALVWIEYPRNNRLRSWHNPHIKNDFYVTGRDGFLNKFIVYDNENHQIANTRLPIIYPAPTLAEILAELPFGSVVMLDAPNVWACISSSRHDVNVKIKKADTPAEAAMCLWLKLKGIEG